MRQALLVLWQAVDRISGKRLHAILPSLVEALEQHGHLDLAPNIRELRLAASAATIDRLLRPARDHVPRCKKRKSSPQAHQEIPIRTFADWGIRRRDSWKWISSLTAAARWRELSSEVW